MRDSQISKVLQWKLCVLYRHWPHLWSKKQPRSTCIKCVLFFMKKSDIQIVFDSSPKLCLWHLSPYTQDTHKEGCTLLGASNAQVSILA